MTLTQELLDLVETVLYRNALKRELDFILFGADKPDWPELPDGEGEVIK